MSLLSIVGLAFELIELWWLIRSTELLVTLTVLKVEFLIEIQLYNESAFLNEFSSQLEPVKLGSNSGSDTSNTETNIDLGINT